MSTINKIDFTDSAGNHYRLDLTLDDAQIMQDRLTIEVVARQLEYRDGPQVDAIGATVSFIPAENIVEILLKGLENPIVIKLDRLEPSQIDQADEVGEGENGLTLMEYLLEHGSESSVEELLQAIPVEPGLGCLLKAGISTTVGQLIQCNFHTHADNGLRQKIWDMLRCLQVNGLIMASKIVGRTIKCIASLGMV